MKWIKCSEQLPDKYGWYAILSLVSCAECKVDSNHLHRTDVHTRYDIGHWTEPDKSLFCHLEDSGCDITDYAYLLKSRWTHTRFYADEITHWCELPEEPKE